MISRRAFLSALSVVPFIGKYFRAALAEGVEVGRSVHTPREVREYATMQDRPGHSVFVCPFDRPLGRMTDCPCKQHELHRKFVEGHLRAPAISVSEWYAAP